MGELIFKLSICSWWQQWVGVATVVLAAEMAEDTYHHNSE